MKTHDFGGVVVVTRADLPIASCAFIHGGRAYVLLRSEGEELDSEARRLMAEELSRLPDGEHEACIEALCRANPHM